MVRSGLALVRVKGSGTFEGPVFYDGDARAVHLQGCRLRVVTGTSYEPTVTYRRRVDRIVPSHRCEIEWLLEVAA